MNNKQSLSQLYWVLDYSIFMGDDPATRQDAVAHATRNARLLGQDPPDPNTVFAVLDLISKQRQQRECLANQLGIQP